MSVEVTKPTEGTVTITLPYDEAEILTRAVGLINTGSLKEHAPGLYDLMTQLIAEFGRSIDHEARKYLLEDSQGFSLRQAYINDYLE